MEPVGMTVASATKVRMQSTPTSTISNERQVVPHHPSHWWDARRVAGLYVRTGPAQHGADASSGLRFRASFHWCSISMTYGDQRFLNSSGVFVGITGKACVALSIPNGAAQASRARGSPRYRRPDIHESPAAYVARNQLLSAFGYPPVEARRHRWGTANSHVHLHEPPPLVRCVQSCDWLFPAQGNRPPAPRACLPASCAPG